MDWHWIKQVNNQDINALIVFDQSIHNLIQRLSRETDESLGKFLIVSNPQFLILFADGAELPWVKGAAYITQNKILPDIWLPTLWQPSVPIDLIYSAITQKINRSPVLLWNDPKLIIPLDKQFPLTRSYVTGSLANAL